MTIHRNWQLQLTEEHILRAEGADPALIQQRKPALYAAACQALKLGMPLVLPVLASRSYQVISIQHQDILLEGDISLRSPLLTNHFKNAHTLVFCVCTIGAELERSARQCSATDPVLSMALDALGSAAVELLTMEVCRSFENQVPSTFVSQPIGPGLEGWSVMDGQPRIFELVDAENAGVALTESMLMQPVKSASFVLGMSSSPFQAGSTCEYCNLRETCRYKGNHAQG